MELLYRIQRRKQLGFLLRISLDGAHHNRNPAALTDNVREKPSLSERIDLVLLSCLLGRINMILVRRIQTGEGELFKLMRLAALRESPFAFASTYEAALRRNPESWSQQANNTAQGSDRSTFIAFSDDSPIGIAALYRTEEESDLGKLLQMWVSPKYRGKGVARGLMNAVFQ